MVGCHHRQRNVGAGPTRVAWACPAIALGCFCSAHGHSIGRSANGGSPRFRPILARPVDSDAWEVRYNEAFSGAGKIGWLGQPVPGITTDANRMMRRAASPVEFCNTMKPVSTIVVALGGNAISQSNEEGRVDQQFARSREAARPLADLVESGHQLVVTHGNGPQIGNFMLRNEAAAGLIYPLAMEVAVAHVQGGMGFMIAQSLTNELQRRGRSDIVTAIVTTVLVDLNDPSFQNPTKPVGRELTRAEVERERNNADWSVKETAPGRFRRVVPSPMPLRIVEIEHIRRAVAAGELLVVCGGGGVPVIRDPEAGYQGVRAVIDKDLASALLAAELGADALMILTGVDRVKLDFGKPGERALEYMTVAQARGWMDEGQFPAGSMGPKVQAGIEFLKRSTRPGAAMFIGPLEAAADTLAGRIGTRMTR